MHAVGSLTNSVLLFKNLFLLIRSNYIFVLMLENDYCNTIYKGEKTGLRAMMSIMINSPSSVVIQRKK